MKAWIKDWAARIKADLLRAHKSLTIWFNSVLGAAVVLLPVAQDQMPQLQDYLSVGLYHYAMGAR